MQAKASPSLVGSRVSPQSGWCGVGFVIRQGTKTFKFNGEPFHAYKMRGNLNCSIRLEPFSSIGSSV